MQLRSVALAGAVTGLIMLVTAPMAPAVTPALLTAAITPTPAPAPKPLPKGPRIYKLPYSGGSGFDVCQGNNHAGSTHVGLAAYAWDFCMPIGTPVLAARGGSVLAVRQSSNVGGWGPSFANAANFVVVDHGDGSAGLYMHLMFMGARVKVGDRVDTGQLIAYSGNTGWTSAPHLHFMVMKTDQDDYYTQSMPVLFTDVLTDGGLPLEDNSYTSGNAKVDARYQTPTGPPPFVPFWVQTFRASTLWSGSDDKAVSFGPVGPWSYFQVTAPQAGPRLQVTVAATGEPAFVPASDVGPSGPPPNSTPAGSSLSSAPQAAVALASPPPPAGSAPPQAAPGSGQIVVGDGDTLFSIAKAHQLTVDRLAVLNGLKDPNALSVGQVLKLG
jgi:murein DD-endopeptidase MepM/ murein hydrolase activator NlpD